MQTKLTLFRSSKDLDVWEDLNVIESLLGNLSRNYGVECKIIDTVGMSDDDLMEHYIKAILPSIKHKYRVRTVFGSNRYPGVFFGRQRPALLVEGDQWDIYPHEKYGKKVTIEEFLQKLESDYNTKSKVETCPS
jgi:hypothetical protein